MRTSFVLSLTLLIIVLAVGIFGAQLTQGVCQRYLSAAEELGVLTQDGHWDRAGETVSAYRESWAKTEKWLQILCNHEDTDAVSMALMHVAAGIEAQDPVLCAEAVWELREDALRIQRRNALTWGNVL